MAHLTRKFLRALGVEEEKIDEIVNAHQDTLEEIKLERDSLKDSASKLAEAQAEVTRLSGELEKAQKNSGDAAKVQADFDAYKQQVEAERLNQQTDGALYDLAKKAGIQRESFLKLAVKNFDRETIKRGDGNAIANADELVEAFKAEFPDFLAAEPEPRPAPTITPPPGPAKPYTKEQIEAMTPEEINKNWDAIKGTLASLNRKEN